MFRSAHRGRARTYLSQDSPERVPMTSGKGVLKPTVEESLDVVDGLMLDRAMQTI